ncbi:MAG: ABC transporter ATP-binding protein [Candidatus Marinimicrobia bacterium]|nr:ABC transporter ATP-binding protein [Candidatus Neomarinimicrobiota bacterium]MDX9778383.1 ABC transporter ATP-binding protein [bacterium]
MEHVIECQNLTHYYGDKLVLNNLDLKVERGRIFGILGKNGMGKTTTINILMGFLRPTSGKCLVLGEESHKLSPETRQKIGLLHEGHLAYDFMTIRQVEKFYSAFFPNWKPDYYWDLIGKLGLSDNHKIKNMSCGQRSQVVLGLIFAQDPELLILDDYSMGLDPGYRALFIDYLQEYVREKNKTVFLTSHIIQDVEKVVDDTIIMGHQKLLLNMPLATLKKNFHRYEFRNAEAVRYLKIDDDFITNLEFVSNKVTIYSFKSLREISAFLDALKLTHDDIREIPMSLEEAFIGLTGKY